MIKEKYKWYISIVSMILSIILVISLIFTNNTNEEADGRIQTKLTSVLDEESITEINIDIDESDWQWLIDNATDEEFRSCNITINGETFYNVGIRPKGNTSLSSVASDDTTDRYSFKIKFNKYVDGQTYHGIESLVLNNNIQDNTYMKEYITYDLYNFLGVATPEKSYSNIKVNNEEWGLYLALEVIDERYLENNFGAAEGNLYKPETMGVGGGNAGAGVNPPTRDENGDKQGAGGAPDMNIIQNKNRQQEQSDNMGIPPNEKANDIAEDVNSSIENQVIEQISPTQENNNQIGEQNLGGGGNPSNGREMNGADFVYKDDNISSYSTVRDSAVLKATTDDDFKNVINMYKNLNNGTNLEEVLDVEEVLKYFAVNTFVVNLDSYSGAMYHNYYLYEKDGQCQILPWDLNLSFGGYGAKGGSGANSEISTAINFPIDNPVTGELESMPLIGKLLEVDEYKELYHSYLSQIANEYFNSGYYDNLVNKIDNLISSYVKEDPTAFCTYEEYEASIPEMITFGEDRTKSVLAQLSKEQPSTTYGNVESTINMNALGNMGGGGGPGNLDGNVSIDAENINTQNNKSAMPTFERNTEQGNNENGGMHETIEENNNTNNAVSTKEESNEDTVTSKSEDVVPKNHGILNANNQELQQDKTKYYELVSVLIFVGLIAVIFSFKFKRKGKLK